MRDNLDRSIHFRSGDSESILDPSPGYLEAVGERLRESVREPKCTLRLRESEDTTRQVIPGAEVQMCAIRTLALTAGAFVGFDETR